MAGDDEGEAILGAHGACRTWRARAPCERGELAVRDDLATRDSAKRVGDPPLGGGRPPEIELDVDEVRGSAREERAEPLHQRIGPALRCVVPEAERVLHEDAVRAPDL